MRFSLRFLFIGIFLVSIGLAWYAGQKKIRNSELASIERMKLRSVNGAAAFDYADGHAFDGCGTWSGVVAYTSDLSPSLIQHLCGGYEFDLFARVTDIEVQDEFDSRIIQELSSFNHLRSFRFEWSYIAHETEAQKFLDAVVQFQRTHPKVRVWSSNLSGATYTAANPDSTLSQNHAAHRSGSSIADHGCFSKPMPLPSWVRMIRYPSFSIASVRAVRSFPSQWLSRASRVRSSHHPSASATIVRAANRSRRVSLGMGTRVRGQTSDAHAICGA
jgi:hypothetical protein